jgi:hypothetical protein
MPSASNLHTAIFCDSGSSVTGTSAWTADAPTSIATSVSPRSTMIDPITIARPIAQ